GLVKPAEFSPDHRPAFVRGDPPQPYLCVYPFVRTPEWYLLPAEERAEMLRTHGAAGREFPQVVGNTTNAFGLGDWEWILAFESPELDAIVDAIRRLREMEARRVTKEEVPFITGMRHPHRGCDGRPVVAISRRRPKGSPRGRARRCTGHEAVARIRRPTAGVAGRSSAPASTPRGSASAGARCS